ncbi:MAG: right-handed parallel beta-helix repeat-containing protein [Acidimicrobiales bacterium]
MGDGPTLGGGPAGPFPAPDTNASELAQGFVAEIHVAPDGSDTASGREGEPLATINVALTRVGPGQTVRLAPGRYRQDVVSVRPGRPGAPVAISGPPEAVVTGAGADHVVEINHSHHLLSGFTIDGHHGPGTEAQDYREKLLWIAGRQAGGVLTSVEVRAMSITNALGECVRLRYFATANLLAENRISQCGLDDYRFGGDGKNGEGIYIGTAPEQRDDGSNPTADPDRSDENVVRNNVIDTGGNECVDIKEDSRGNLVEGNSCTGQRDPESAGLDSRGNENRFVNNTVFGNDGAGIRLGGDSDADGTGNDVVGNQLRENRAGGVKFMRRPQGRVCGNSFSGNGAADSVGSHKGDFRPAQPC